MCLEQKQKRDREAQIIAQIQPPSVVPTSVQQQQPQQPQSSSTTVTIITTTTTSSANPTNLYGSFRRASLQERKQDPQNVIPAGKTLISVFLRNPYFLFYEKIFFCSFFKKNRPLKQRRTPTPSPDRRPTETCSKGKVLCECQLQLQLQLIQIKQIRFIDLIV